MVRHLPILSEADDVPLGAARYAGLQRSPSVQGRLKHVCYLSTLAWGSNNTIDRQGNFHFAHRKLRPAVQG